MYRGRWSICLPIEVWEKWAGLKKEGKGAMVKTTVVVEGQEGRLPRMLTVR